MDLMPVEQVMEDEQYAVVARSRDSQLVIGAESTLSLKKGSVGA
jgi:hypothetical protein